MFTIQQHQRPKQDRSFIWTLETLNIHNRLLQMHHSIDLSNTFMEVSQSIRRYERMMTNKCRWSLWGRLHMTMWQLRRSWARPSLLASLSSLQCYGTCQCGLEKVNLPSFPQLAIAETMKRFLWGGQEVKISASCWYSNTELNNYNLHRLWPLFTLVRSFGR